MVSSVNANANHYERKFSLGKAATSAAAGAAIFKVSNDAILRKNASQTIQLLRGSNADEFIKTANLSKGTVKSTVRNAQKVMKTTEYLNTIKENVKNPKTILENGKKFATETVKNVKSTNLKDIPSKAKGLAKGVPSKAKGIVDKFATTAKSFKGATVKETLSNVLKATKTVKGRQAVTVALGAICGLMLFGTSKAVKSKENQA